MGPIALFDKSFLQSLSVDESVWFDGFFLTTVCPIFFVETLADLAKTKLRNRSAFEEVRIMANKYPFVGSSVCEHHMDLALRDLLGFSVPMTGQIPLVESQMVSVEGEMSLRQLESSVAKAFLRWQDEEFFQLEKEYAHSWRESLNNINLKYYEKQFHELSINVEKCKSFEEAKCQSLQLLDFILKPDANFNLIFDLLSIPHQYHSKIRDYWKKTDSKYTSEFAPYASYSLLISIFSIIILNSGLLVNKPNNFTDLAYLYYLPFCMIFISSDKLHQKIAPLFLRKNQEFILGQELKLAVRELNLYFSSLPELERDKGVIQLANIPPSNVGTLVSTLWDHHLNPNWRQRKTSNDSSSREKHIEIMEKSEKIVNAIPIEKPLSEDENSPRSASLQPKSAYIKREIKSKRGSWYIVPKSYLENRDQ